VLERRAAEAAETEATPNGDFLSIADKKSGRGRPTKAAGEAHVAAVLGIAQSTLNYAKQHVEAMERYPALAASRRDDRDGPLTLGYPPGAEAHRRRNADPTRGVD
jgi:hypothetical protein